MSAPQTPPTIPTCPQHSGVEARLENIESTQVEIKQRVAKLEDSLDQKLSELSRAVNELGASMRAKGASIDVWTALLGAGALAVVSAIISQVVSKLIH